MEMSELDFDTLFGQNQAIFQVFKQVKQRRYNVLIRVLVGGVRLAVSSL